MKYNECKTCGANNGRAGTLVNDECENCYETRKRGGCFVNSNLKRTTEELSKTFAILSSQTMPGGDR